MSLRVLHVLDHSLPMHSGYTFRTLAILREQRALGWETFHLTSPKHSAGLALQEEIDGWRFSRTVMPEHAVDRLPLARELRLMQHTEARIMEVARAVQPHVVHAHSPVLNAIPALRAARRLGIPMVYEVRAFWEDAAVDHGTHRDWGVRYRLTRMLETQALRRADHVTTICEGLRQEMTSRGISADKITVIPNAVDIDGFAFGSPRDDALAESLGLRGKTVIGFVGSFYAYEGLDLLIRAFPRLLAERPDARLLLVGGGPQERKLQELSQTLGVSNYTRFVGRVPHAEVQRYYSVIDLLAYPRHPMRLTDLVTPLKPLEAMAQGRLVVASDVGGHRELIRDQETGMLFKAGSVEHLASVLADLLNHKEKWPALRERARRFVEQERNWAGSVARYVPIMERLLGERTDAAA